MAIYEKRIQKLSKDYQKEARELIKPTEKQVNATADLVTWLMDRYAPAFLNSPYVVPLTLTYTIGSIEITKFWTFKSIEKSAMDEGEND